MTTATATRTDIEFRGEIRELFTCDDDRVLVEGPAGTGKTTGLMWFARMCMDNYPGLRVLFARETRESMSETVLVTWEDKVLGPNHPAVKDGPRRSHRQSYVFPNGSSAVVCGLDKPSKTFSAEYDLIFVFEAVEITQDQAENLIRALRNGRRRRRGKVLNQLVLDTNPGPETHWLNVMASAGWMKRICTRHEDNPYLHDGDDWTPEGRVYINTLDGLTGHRRIRLKDGKWASSDGVVYPEFDSVVHTIGEMPAGWQAWPKYRSIDFGYNDPFVCQWWAVNDGRMYLYREWFCTGLAVPKHAEKINELSAGEEYVATVADHDAGERATLDLAGIHTQPAKKDIKMGLDAVRSRLLKDGIGRPRIHLLRSSLVHRDPEMMRRKHPIGTREEFESYVYAKTAGSELKEKPVDKHNHAMDAMRYAVMAVDGGNVVPMWA